MDTDRNVAGSSTSRVWSVRSIGRPATTSTRLTVGHGAGEHRKKAAVPAWSGSYCATVRSSISEHWYRGQSTTFTVLSAHRRTTPPGPMSFFASGLVTSTAGHGGGVSFGL